MLSLEQRLHPPHEHIHGLYKMALKVKSCYLILSRFILTNTYHAELNLLLDRLSVEETKIFNKLFEKFRN